MQWGLVKPWIVAKRDHPTVTCTCKGIHVRHSMVLNASRYVAQWRRCNRSWIETRMISLRDAKVSVWRITLFHSMTSRCSIQWRHGVMFIFFQDIPLLIVIVQSGKTTYISLWRKWRQYPDAHCDSLQQRDAKNWRNHIEATFSITDARIAVFHIVLLRHIVTLSPVLAVAKLVLGVLVVLGVAWPRRRLLANQRRIGAPVSGNAGHLKKEKDIWNDNHYFLRLKYVTRFGQFWRFWLQIFTQK